MISRNFKNGSNVLINVRGSSEVVKRAGLKIPSLLSSGVRILPPSLLDLVRSKGFSPAKIMFYKNLRRVRILPPSLLDLVRSKGFSPAKIMFYKNLRRVRILPPSFQILFFTRPSWRNWIAQKVYKYKKC